jgi:hypothetical protein
MYAPSLCLCQWTLTCHILLHAPPPHLFHRLAPTLGELRHLEQLSNNLPRVLATTVRKRAAQPLAMCALKRRILEDLPPDPGRDRAVEQVRVVARAVPE